VSRAALVVLVVLAGCRRPPDAALPVVIAPALGEPPHETVAPAPLARGPSQTIDIRYDRAADAWDVTWTFAEPTLGLVFDRRKPRFRTATWTAAPGAHWAIEGDAETLRADDETARTTFAVRFATDDASRQRAMPLNLRWRDGGRLLFTGSLGGHALVCGPTACTRRDVGTERIWQISAAGELRILATTGRDTLTWHEPMGELRGTYLYVGARTATDVAEVTTLVDRGVPAWLAAATQRDLPPLLASYAARTGVALPFRPLVLISRGPSTARRRRGVRGSALPGLVQLEANGGGWDRDGRAARRQWFELGRPRGLPPVEQPAGAARRGPRRVVERGRVVVRRRPGAARRRLPRRPPLPAPHAARRQRLPAQPARPAPRRGGRGQLLHLR